MRGTRVANRERRERGLASVLLRNQNCATFWRQNVQRILRQRRRIASGQVYRNLSIRTVRFAGGESILAPKA